MKTRGMTLVEVMIATAVMTVVMGAVLATAITFSDMTRLQNIEATNMDECSRALQQIVPDIRQSIRSSINWAQLPGPTLSYRVPQDLDGNGLAVDVNISLETSLPRVIGRDTNDQNQDGETLEQLVVNNGNTVTVLANNLSPDSESTGADDILDPAEDLNGNGQLDSGIWFEPWNQGLRITIQTQGRTRQGHIIRATHQEIVIPMN